MYRIIRPIDFHIFSEGLKPPTSLDHQPNEDIRFNTLNVSRGCLASERPTLFGLAYV